MKLLLDLQVSRILKQFSKVALKWKVLVCLEISIQIILEPREARGRVRRSGPCGFVRGRAGCFSMVEHKMANWTHETVRAGWKSVICSETKWLGLHSSAWNCDQTTSRLGLVVCHQHRNICTAFRGHACLGISAPTALTHLGLLCFGRSDSVSAAWMVVDLLENQPIFFPFPFPMLSQMRCQHLPLFIAGRVHVTADVEVFSASSTE